MKQIPIYLTEEQHEALRAKAFVQRTSITELVRKAVDVLLAEQKSEKKGNIPF